MEALQRKKKASECSLRKLNSKDLVSFPLLCLRLLKPFVQGVSALRFRFRACRQMGTSGTYVLFNDIYARISSECCDTRIVFLSLKVFNVHSKLLAEIYKSKFCPPSVNFFSHCPRDRGSALEVFEELPSSCYMRIRFRHWKVCRV